MKCPYYQQCGACAYALDAYAHSLKCKHHQLITLFGPTNPILGMDQPYGYRHKVTVSFRQTQTGIIAGIYAQNSHQLIPIDHCALHHPLGETIIDTVVKTANAFKYRAYDEDHHIGELRHLQLRISMDAHVLMTLVVSTTKLKGSRQFFDTIRQQHPQIVSIVMNVNNRNTSMILGDHQRIVYGSGMVKDQMDHLTFRISSKSFYQVNPQQALRCYHLVFDHLKLDKTTRVIDAYCGTGTIGSLIADRVKSVIGIDVNRNAIVDAINNAKTNGITNISFKVGSVDRYLDLIHSDVVVVDPPRSGCSKSFLDAIIRNKIAQIGYISCNPDTQKRDCDYLGSHGYTITFLQGVDMFPFTQHLESIAVLVRTKK